SDGPHRDGQVGPDPRRLASRLGADAAPAQPRAFPGVVSDRLRAVQRHHLRRPHRPAGRDRPGLGPSLQRARPRRHDLPPHLRPPGRPPPPFAQPRPQRTADVAENSPPAEPALPGHGWTLKKPKQWVSQALGLQASRSSIRRILRRAKLTWKKVKKLLGRAKPE